jgi:Xaa-Pro aminopeptidase
VSAPRALLEERWQAVSLALESEGLDALLVAGRGLIGQYGDVFYLTGFPLFNSVGHGYALLCRDEPVRLVVGKRDQELAPAFGVEELVVQQDVPDAPAVGGTGLIGLAAQTLASRGISRGRLAIAGLDLVMPAGDWLALRELLPELELVNAGQLLARLKAIKSPEELELYAEAVALADAGWERFIELVEPGRTEAELAAEVERVVRERGALGTIIQVLTGRMYTRPATQRRLAEGEVVCCYVEPVAPNGYWVEKGGMFVLGRPPDRWLEVLDVAERAYVEGERLLTPGRSAREVTSAIEAVAREGGCETGIWSGHGVGIDHDLPLLNGVDKTALEPNMVISLHPHVCDAEFGAFTLDQYTITADGPVRHSRFPRELREL